MSNLIDNRAAGREKELMDYAKDIYLYLQGDRK